ncbi:MAG: hypothetical protein EOO52_08295 [Gammaproteobacteria bacterium]|nr:MAG: hypothetical protein EOO52_08295 [Gammaproteobacteria bacterium]
MSNEHGEQAVTFGGITNPSFIRTLPISNSRSIRPAQNWVLDPIQDFIFIIAAPLICLGLAVLAMQYYGAARGATMVIMAHVVLTVAHHMPTFIRIYGDLDLLQRFKWNFLLGPVVPVLFSAGVLGYLNYHHYPVEYFLYLYIFLALWDPWHFLRQHFGFMRIYDRHNKAPIKLASNMDWAICGIWFVHIMAASADWIPGLLEDLYRNTHIPLLLILPQGFIGALKSITWWFAMTASAVYAGYLMWCLRRGYYISIAKLALLICTFGVMYFTYTPNDWILQLVPAWGFKVGFATLGIVHMTQYLAIVWRYDQRIAQQGRARPNWFQKLHGQRTAVGVALAAAVYVLFCIGYGNVITTSHENRWLMSTLLAVGFTSTLMHYYFDGFIWRVRHQQNREALNLQEQPFNLKNKSSLDDPLDIALATMSPAFGSNNPQETKSFSAQASSSWWNNSTQISAGRMLLKQLLYFGVPMGILTAGAVSVWNAGNTNYVQHMYYAQTLSQQGQATAAEEAARKAYASMQAELPFAEKMVDLKPSSSNQAQLAFLIYNQSLYKNRIMPALAGMSPTASQQQDQTTQTRRAAELLQNAVFRGEALGHPGREQFKAEEAERIIASWRRQAQL